MLFNLFRSLFPLEDAIELVERMARICRGVKIGNYLLGQLGLDVARIAVSALGISLQVSYLVSPQIRA
jgi:hypothetical protein